MNRQAQARIHKMSLNRRALMAFRLAVKEVMAEHVRKDLPIYVWRNNKIVDVLPEMKARSLQSHHGRQRTVRIL